LASTLLLGQVGLQLTRRHAVITGTHVLNVARDLNPWSDTLAFYDAEACWHLHQSWHSIFQTSLHGERQNATYLASATLFLATAHQYGSAERLAHNVIGLTPWQASGYQLLSQVALTQSVLDPIGSAVAERQAQLAEVTAQRFFRRVTQEPSDVHLRNQTRTIQQPIALNGFLGATLAQEPQHALAWAPLLPRTPIIQTLLLANLRAKTSAAMTATHTVAALVHLLRKSLTQNDR
jgi:hypothetical protein